MKFQDYYETLGVARTAPAEDIKQAFRKLARLYHPDVAKNKVTGEAKFKEINEAYEVLGDPEKRRRYDELGADWQEGAAAPGGSSSSCTYEHSAATPSTLPSTVSRRAISGSSDMRSSHWGAR